jgi:hypothetical protein
MAACSDDADDGGGADVAATSEDIAAYCEATCDENARCSPASTRTRAECVSDCQSGTDRFAGVVRRDILADEAPCFETIACEENDDRCLDDAAAANGIDVKNLEADPEVKACLARHEECAGTAGDFTDDICGVHLLFVTSKKLEVERCFDLSCDTIADCLGAYE